MLAGDGSGRNMQVRDKFGVWDLSIHTTFYQKDDLCVWFLPRVEMLRDDFKKLIKCLPLLKKIIYRDLLIYSTRNSTQYSVIIHLYGKRIWKRMDTYIYIYITESLNCTTETNTTLYINYTPLQNFLKLRKKKGVSWFFLATQPGPKMLWMTIRSGQRMNPLSLTPFYYWTCFVNSPPNGEKSHMYRPL